MEEILRNSRHGKLEPEPKVCFRRVEVPYLAAQELDFGWVHRPITFLEGMGRDLAEVLRMWMEPHAFKAMRDALLKEEVGF
jgi:hypothetical protein